MNVFDWVLFAGIILGSFFVLSDIKGELNPKALRFFGLIGVIASTMVLAVRLTQGTC